MKTKFQIILASYLLLITSSYPEDKNWFERNWMWALPVAAVVLGAGGYYLFSKGGKNGDSEDYNNTPVVTNSTNWQEFKSADFNNWSVNSSYDPSKIATDFGRNPKWYVSGGTKAMITSDGENGNGLRVEYPPGQVGSEASGVSFMVALPNEYEYLLTYKVYFENGFQWKNGGKLPGLAGGTATAGGSKPNGDGYTARFMWRNGGELELYLYHMDMPDQWGHRFSIKQNVLRPGVWYSLEISLKVNTDNQKNGYVIGTIRSNSGEVLGSRTVSGIRWREGTKAYVNRLYFETFFGGNNAATDSPDYTNYVRFDTVKVYRRER